MRKAVIAAAIAVGAACAVVAAAWFSAPVPRALGQKVKAVSRRHGSSATRLSHIARVMREAVVDTEDERFFRHHGIDIVGLIRSAAYDVSHLSGAQGASTITEQLAKNVYLHGDDHSPWRKLVDATLAIRIESAHSKQDILGDYLDCAYFGHGAFGIDAASHVYFGVTPSHLTLARASLLAGLIQAPVSYDPYRYPEAARRRQAYVLTSMVRNGSITIAEGELVLTHRLPLASSALPAGRRVDLSPASPFAMDRLALGSVMTAAGLCLLLAGRRARWRIAWAAAGVMVLVAGGLVFLDSLQTF